MERIHKNLLVPTDGSFHSLRVLPHAALFAEACEATLMLAKLLKAPDDIVAEPDEPDAAAIARTLAATESELNEILSNAGISGEVLAAMLQEEEDTAQAILRHSGDAAMIAMDTRGYGALHHLLQGSVALEVLARTSLPVMLTGAEVLDAGEPQAVYRILATSDGSPASTDVLKALAPLLTPGRFAVTLLRVHEMKPGEDDPAVLRQIQDNLDSLRAIFPPGLALDTKVRNIVPMGGIDTAIIEEARHLGAKAIATSTHGTSAARHLLAGSTALLLLGRSPLPVIMARAQD
jgi:nucleotide-binding universal stress UspA family protein